MLETPNNIRVAFKYEDAMIARSILSSKIAKLHIFPEMKFLAYQIEERGPYTVSNENPQGWRLSHTTRLTGTARRTRANCSYICRVIGRYFSSASLSGQSAPV
jgi:hypothetical protein